MKFLHFSKFLWVTADPDPADQNQCGFGSSRPKSMRIRIQPTKINADPDPQNCFFFTKKVTAPYFEVDNSINIAEVCRIGTHRFLHLWTPILFVYRSIDVVYTVKKGYLVVFPSPAGISLTKLSLAGKTANLFFDSVDSFCKALFRVADPDWIRIQSCQWIRIRNPDPDPGGQKWPTEVRHKT